MASNKQKIYSPEWLVFHPYEKSANSDFYYTQLANRVCETINNTLNSIENKDYLFMDDKEIAELSCILTAYFEDIISETNIWNGFVKENKGRIGKELPFYACDEYAEQEINEQDIQFLIWNYITNMYQMNVTIDPAENMFSAIAKEVYHIFDNEFETAPVNEKLQKFLAVDNKQDVIYDLHQKLYWLGTESYLFYFNSKRLETEIKEVVATSENQAPESLSTMIDMMIGDYPYNNETEFWCMRAPQWYANIVGEEHPLYNDLKSMSTKKVGFFMYQSENEETTAFRHVATGRIVEIYNRSIIGLPKEYKENKLIAFMGFVEWQGKNFVLGEVKGLEYTEQLEEDIKGDESELSLFDIEEQQPYDATKLDKQLTETIASIKEECEQQDEDVDILLEVMRDSDFPFAYIREAILSDKFQDLKFGANDDRTILKNNVDFIIDFFK